jgi:hypothetical protein
MQLKGVIMKKILNLISVLFFVFPVFAQLPWSAPQLLCDSTGDNRNPAFVRGEFFSFDYNVLLWERDFGSHSEIYLKDFADPDSEIAVNPFAGGGFSQKPAGTFIEYMEKALIVWQSDQPGNFDLFSIVFYNGQFSDYRQITNDPGDDLNPKLFDNQLVWERDSCIYHSSYTSANATWRTPQMLDSVGCANPTIATPDGYTAAYQKRDGSEFKIWSRRKTSSSWNPPQLISPEGDNRFPRYSHGLPLSLIWQHRNMSDWNIMNLSVEWPFPTLFTFSPNDEFHPVALEIPYISKEQFYPPLYFAFESANPGEETEIYANDILYDPATVRNISGYAGTDRHPALSEFSFEETTAYMARAWLAWQSFRNGKWQIWGSFAETDIPGLGIDDQPAAIMNHQLFQNYPNPFNPETAISYIVPVGRNVSNVELAIYNLLGQKVRTLVQARQPAGLYEIHWDGRDDAGKAVASGIYLYRLRAGDFVQSRKMVLLR